MGCSVPHSSPAHSLCLRLCSGPSHPVCLSILVVKGHPHVQDPLLAEPVVLQVVVCCSSRLDDVIHSMPSVELASAKACIEYTCHVLCCCGGGQVV